MCATYLPFTCAIHNLITCLLWPIVTAHAIAKALRLSVSYRAKTCYAQRGSAALHSLTQNAEARHAETAEIHERSYRPEADRARPWLAEAPLRLGHCRSRLADLYDHLPHAVRHQHAHSPSPEPPGIRLELL